jgi:mRNA-degrading endonuclease RelE of RelBE toxin-antitoxin system
MTDSAVFRVVFAPETVRHVAAIDRRHHGLIRRSIRRLLAREPDSPSRNRKPLHPPAPFESTWEIRFGPGNRFRVFYDVDAEAHTVWILAIGVKVRDRLWFGDEEYTP